MERITVKDVRRSFEWYHTAMDRAGLIEDGTSLCLQEGSSTYGIGWRVYVLVDGDGGGHHRPLVGDDYLGRTARDAYERLADRARVLDDVMWAEERGMRKATVDS